MSGFGVPSATEDGGSATSENQVAQIALEQHIANDLDYIAGDLDDIRTFTASTSNNTSTTATNTSTIATSTTAIATSTASTATNTSNTSTNTSNLNAKFGSLGQKTMTGSAPVVIASDNGLALDTTLTGGTAQSIVRGGVKGATAAATITSTANGADHQAMDVTEQLAPVAEDNSNGIIATIQKPLSVATYCPLFFTNFGANNTLNIKTSTGNIFSFICQNLNASARFIQFHNTATVPVNTNIPLLTFPIPGSSTLIIGNDFFTQTGLHFVTGIAFAFSTTNNTLTLGTAADQVTTVVYI